MSTVPTYIETPTSHLAHIGLIIMISVAFDWILQKKKKKRKKTQIIPKLTNYILIPIGPFILSNSLFALIGINLSAKLCYVCLLALSTQYSISALINTRQGIPTSYGTPAPSKEYILLYGTNSPSIAQSSPFTTQH